MNNKGFALIETIIVMVLLLVVLVSLYTGFNSIYVKEQQYLYYDDIAYLYKTEHVRDILFSTSGNGTINISTFKSIIESGSYVNGTNPFYHIEVDNKDISNDLIDDTNKTIFTNLKTLYNIHDIIYVPFGTFDCSDQCIKVFQSSVENSVLFQTRISDMHDTNNLIFNYIKKLDVDNILKQNNKAKGILMVIYYETKSGVPGANADYQYTNCIEANQTMNCQKAINISWVYVDYE